MSRRNQKILLLAAAIVIVAPLFIWGSIQYTSRPQFCNTCHYMTPFFESWSESAHSDVTCTECHFEPGLTGKIKGKLNGLYQLTKYVSSAYKKSKPWAEISDESCMRSECHPEQTLQGAIQFKQVHFDHRAHLGELRRGKELRCTSCHSQMVQGQHIVVTEATCFICHMKDREIPTRMNQCQTCHTSEIFLEQGSQLRYNHTTVVETGKDCQMCHTNTIQGNGNVAVTQCINCHWQTDFLQRIDDPEFLHDNHVAENKIECIACHVPILHEINRVQQLTGEDCRSCHQDMHAAQARFFTGVNPHTEPMPNPMFKAGMACQSCHIFHADNLKDGDTMVSSPEACDKCHGAGYGHLLNRWETKLESLDKETSDYLAEARRVLTKQQKSQPDIAANLTDAANKIDEVRLARGIHNIKLSSYLLEDAHEDISKTLLAAGLKSVVHQEHPNADLIPADCANCHFGIDEISVEVFNLNFQHATHLNEGVTCSKCHSNLRKHGELLLNRSECLNCHHSREDRGCESCHAEQAQLLQGKTPFFTVDADYMWDADVTCQDCHQVETGTVRRDAAVCADCHDEDYPEMVAEWRTEIQFYLNKLPWKYRAQVDWINNEGSLGGHNPQAIIDYLEGL